MNPSQKSIRNSFDLLIDIRHLLNFQAMFASNMVDFVQKESVRIIDITQVMKENHLDDGDDDIDDDKDGERW